MLCVCVKRHRVHRVPIFERLPLGDLSLVLQEHGHLGKEDFVYQLRVWAQVRTAFHSSTAFYLSKSLFHLMHSACPWESQV